MNTHASLDLAARQADTHRTETLGNPDRAAITQAIADRVAANLARGVAPGRHKRSKR